MSHPQVSWALRSFPLTSGCQFNFIPEHFTPFISLICTLVKVIAYLTNKCLGRLTLSPFVYNCVLTKLFIDITVQSNP